MISIHAHPPLFFLSFSFAPGECYISPRPSVSIIRRRKVIPTVFTRWKQEYFSDDAIAVEIKWRTVELEE